MAVPGWPELAFCTESMASVRTVLMQSCSRAVDDSMAVGDFTSGPPRGIRGLESQPNLGAFGAPPCSLPSVLGQASLAPADHKGRHYKAGFANATISFARRSLVQ